MMKRLLVSAMVSLLASTLHAEDLAPKPIGTLKLNLDALRGWQARAYTYRAASPGRTEQTNVGTIRLKTIVTPESVVLDDQLELAYRGEKLSLHLKHECRRDSFLSPVRIESDGSGSDEASTFIVAVDGTEATVRRNGKEQTFELPMDTVTSWAFLRLVTLLPRQKASVIKFDHWMESEELNQKLSFQVESLGTDAIQRGDVEVCCTKFRLEGGGTHPAFYWVDKTGVLQQVLIDERNLIQLVE